MADKDDKQNTAATIARNRRARHEYFISERIEAGLSLEGWEVKALRAGRASLAEGYVLLKNNEAWLFGVTINPLDSVSTHVRADPTRTRKLLLHRNEIDHLKGAVERKGFTLVPLSLFWKRGKAKLDIGLAKGKKLHDKRASDKEKDWSRQKQRLLKSRS